MLGRACGAVIGNALWCEAELGEMGGDGMGDGGAIRRGAGEELDAAYEIGAGEQCGVIAEDDRLDAPLAFPLPFLPLAGLGYGSGLAVNSSARIFATRSCQWCSLVKEGAVSLARAMGTPPYGIPSPTRSGRAARGGDSTIHNSYLRIRPRLPSP